MIRSPEFGDRLRAAREELGFDRKGLADAAGVPVESVIRLESGIIRHEDADHNQRILGPTRLTPMDLFLASVDSYNATVDAFNMYTLYSPPGKGFPLAMPVDDEDLHS